MSASDRQPLARSGLWRRLSSGGPTVAILAVAVTAAAGLVGTAVAGDTALSIRVDQTNLRIDRTNARIDRTHNTLAVRIDETNARINALRADMNAQFDRLFSLLHSIRQEHGRRLDAIERQQADRPPSPDDRATP